jgi:hypothetical protein
MAQKGRAEQDRQQLRVLGKCLIIWSLHIALAIGHLAIPLHFTIWQSDIRSLPVPKYKQMAAQAARRRAKDNQT